MSLPCSSSCQRVIQRKPKVELSQRRGWQGLGQNVKSFLVGKLRLKESLDWIGHPQEYRVGVCRLMFM